MLNGITKVYKEGMHLGVNELEAIKIKIDKAKVVSFDVFDTLLFRKCYMGLIGVRVVFVH